jgi:hypothetical protein
MRFVALIVWFITALWGLYMLAVWLIENDATRQGTAASRLPLPVILAHVTFAVAGLVVWVAYLLLDRPVLAWVAVGILVAIALLGLSMFARWIPVYRMADEELSVPVRAMSGGPPEGAHDAMPGGVPGIGSLRELPAEGSFPLLIVLAHGVFAVSTVVLVVLTALGVGGS